jgi:hypothetical protein
VPEHLQLNPAESRGRVRLHGSRPPESPPDVLDPTVQLEWLLRDWYEPPPSAEGSGLLIDRVDGHKPCGDDFTRRGLGDHRARS